MGVHFRLLFDTVSTVLDLYSVWAFVYSGFVVRKCRKSFKYFIKKTVPVWSLTSRFDVKHGSLRINFVRLKLQLFLR